MTARTDVPRILVAEDDPSIRRLLGATLRRRRLEVELVSDGAEALAALERTCFDVLVMDLMMPNLTGWDVVRWLSEHSDRRPGSVVIVSAADRDTIRDLDPSVVNAIIFKPFDVLQLGAYVKSAASVRRDRRHARTLPPVE